jgi:hypothetical protein
MSDGLWTFCAAVVASLLLVSAAPVPDQLTVGEFDQREDQAYYRQVIRTVLHEGYADDVRARMLVTSVSGETLVGVRLRADSFEIFFLRPEVQLFWYDNLQQLKQGTYRGGAAGVSPEQQAAMVKDLESALPRDVRQVRVERCVTSIEERLGQNLIAAWIRVLGRANRSPPTDDRLVLDGASFHFWVRREAILAGHVNSPDARWPSKHLASIGSQMYMYCRKPTVEGVRALEALVHDTP